MRHTFFKSAIAALLVAGFTSCADELNISSIDPQSSASTEEMPFIAKCYSVLGLTGQEGPSGKGDLSLNEGESGFYRVTFNCEELATDELIWAWQTDDGIPEFTAMSWDASTTRVNWCYTRLGYDITLFNQYIATATNDDYRNEVRFLRALHYWYYLDLFGRAPFKIDNDLKATPEEKVGADLFAWLDSELTDLEKVMQPIGTFNNPAGFGRADAGAAYLLHARLLLNAPVYGAKADYEGAMAKVDALINSGKYALATNEKNGYTGYEQLFMADNDENPEAMQEIIFPIRQDGAKTQCYSAANYLVSSMRTPGMPDMGTTNGWSCNFARGALIEQFFPNIEDCPLTTTRTLFTKKGKMLMPGEEDEEAHEAASEDEIKQADAYNKSDKDGIQAAAGDDRALFYGGEGGDKLRKRKTDKITSFFDGMSIVKWNNHRTDGAAVHGTEFPDVDVPLLRYAEAFMIKAECLLRTGNAPEAKDLLNSTIRSRAHATPINDLTERIMLDEWCREFYTEGRRRCDLVRFNCYTTRNYLWDWKGGVENGTTVDSRFNLFPIPTTDLQNNTNLHQNPGYINE